MDKKGFTLIELVMVIVIIGILAAIAIPRFMDLRKDAKQASCRATGGALRGAVSSFYASVSLRSNTPHYPAAIASVYPFLQGGTPAAPTSGTWTNAYTAATGILAVGETGTGTGTACAKK